MATTPVRSKEMEYAYMLHVLSAKEYDMLPVAVDAAVLSEYAKEGAALYRTKTAGQVRTSEWKLDFGILDREGVINITLGDLFRLPRAERERLASYLVSPPLNARFLKMRLGMGACTDEGEIQPWDGQLRPEA